MNEMDFDGDRPRQLLVCTFGADCAAALKGRDGSAHDLADALKAARNDAGLRRSLYVTKTGCMGWCERAPVAQLLPEGLILSGLRLEDAGGTVLSCVGDRSALADKVVWNYGVSRADNERV